MIGQYVDKIEILNEIVDRENYFRIGYCEQLEIYIMAVYVAWIAGYERYYKISKEDFELYQNEKNDYYKKYAAEIEQKQDCFSRNFIGAAALRDYDGVDGFQKAYSSEYTNAFRHYMYYNGILYARIVWNFGEIYVPPMQEVLDGRGEVFPLRENCVRQRDKKGKVICYKLKMK